MTHQHVSRTNQQSKSDTPLVSGILQRAAVRTVPEHEVQPIEEEATTFRESRFHHNFCQVPVSTGEEPRIQPKLMTFFNSPQQLSVSPIQRQLTIGQPGDKYEQEADRVASQVVEQIHAPASAQSTQGQPVQRQEEADEELQAKPSISDLQRSPLPPQQLQQRPNPQTQAATEGDSTFPGKGTRTGNRQISTNGQRPNQIGLPNRLKAGIEGLSGLSMDDVTVHYNAAKPATLQALAYTQGTHIHIAPGQEQYLAHEAWHVVQQKQKQVQPTTQIEGIQMNDDRALEAEADRMGAKALSQGEIYLQETRKLADPTNRQRERLDQSHQPRQEPQPPLSVVQLVDDPDEVIYGTIAAVHAKLIGKYKLLSNIPKPSAVRSKIKTLISEAEDENKAYQAYADLIEDYFPDQTQTYIDDLKQEIKAWVTATKTATAKEKKDRKDELEKLRRQEQEGESPRKKQRLDSGKASVKVYSDKEKTTLTQKLQHPKMRKTLFATSFRAYQSHRGKARETVRNRAEINALTEDPRPLSTADMAQAQASYKQASMGESLTLEKDAGYQVTMTRTGGQAIHQLGPYLPSGDKQSVKEITTEILKNTKLTSKELAEAINIRDPQELKNWLAQKEKNVSDYYFGKIRAMRHLLAIEKDRGPEVAAATSLEHRSAVHGYSHITSYAENTPLGPPDATVNIKKARTAQIKKDGKKPGDIPSSFDYIPSETVSRSVQSTTTFLTSFVAAPKPDPEASALVEAILIHDETSDQPSDALIDAMEGVMRTPTYTGFGGEQEETEESSKSGVEDEKEAKPDGTDKSPDVITEIDTWQTAAYQSFSQGQKIRITGNDPDISDRVFEFQQDYNPVGEYPDIPSDFLKWMR